MTQAFKTLMILVVTCVVLAACQKDAGNTVQEQKAEVSEAAMAKIKDLGFSTENVIAYNGGYLVEGDIFLTDENLNEKSDSPTLRIAEEEQYRTKNLVKNLPRVITVNTSNLPAVYGTALNNAIAKYNAEGLRITFQRVSGSANITVVGFYEGPSGGFITLGSAGFPTSSGNPYSQIRMNTHPQAYGTNPDVNYLSKVLMHEIGHCIGFRHTDYMNRAYSCGSGGNEGGTQNPGAIHIPGTPTGPNAGSWMLACAGATTNNFNANDRIALNYLY